MIEKIGHAIIINLDLAMRKAKSRRYSLALIFILVKISARVHLAVLFLLIHGPGILESLGGDIRER
jgi:hypothetical protein